MKKKLQEKPKCTSKYLRFVIFDTLCKHSNKDNPLTKTELYNKIFLKDNLALKNFKPIDDDFKCIEKTIDRTLNDLSELEFGFGNIKVYKVPNSCPAKYYAEPINIIESFTNTPNAKTLIDISSAIKTKKMLSFKYITKETTIEDNNIGIIKNKKTFNILPISIITYNDEYYLIAYCESENTLKHFIVKNMRNIKILKYSHNNIQSINAMEYKFQHPFMIEGDAIEISLIIKTSLKQELSQLFGRFVIFSPSHNDIFPIKAEFKATREGVKKWVLSNLGNCYVTSPKNLSEEIKEKIKTTNFYINNLLEEN